MRSGDGAGGGTRVSRADQADHRRAELLEAARRVVLERGISSTRVADIAKATNVSGGLIHYHFATKDELITAMLRTTIDGEVGRLRQLVQDPGTGVERLDRVLRYYIPRSRADQSWLLWIDAFAAGLRETVVQQILLELESGWIGALEQVIRSGVDGGEFTCDDPRGAAERIDGMLDGLIIRYTLHPSVLSRRRLLEHARIAAAREVGLSRADFPDS
ncbi:transcriptional regulator [Sphaerisporangium siamense]|uniref:AcrR family transcriptional regulator n=1 Tax=Sphaerisporangium siamense TaxID=795645 RepID=A0A7W7DCB1_9ACTN|nr:TetR/AcrR family transcriptional regulator [Sphaerisporangium siamense]MBB4703056.1 AcrR family transcriptional regulator [Sphaerisporangium siamense]GII83178.1 transcriptional regulator [Sphaerisporangium siamense]